MRKAPSLAAYVFADNVVDDREVFDDYRSKVGPTVLAYGGRYLLRGGPTETQEGDWMPNGLVVIEFESMDKAREWYNSTEYSAIKGLRHSSAESSLVMVEGV